MNTRYLILLAMLGTLSCKARDENSYLNIVSVIAPTAASAGSGPTTVVTCKFDPGGKEFTELPYEPGMAGSIAVILQNNIKDTTGNFRLNSTTFEPHVAVLDYEIVGQGGVTPPGEQEVPAGASSVPGGGGKGVVGFDVFRGVPMPALNPGTVIRVTMHLKGKLDDGSLVSSADREYLFRACGGVGCSAARGVGAWAVVINNNTQIVSCL